MTSAKEKIRPRSAKHSYAADFFAWTAAQASALEERRLEAIDWVNLAEEVRSLGNSDKDEIESRLQILLLHLLKWSRQPSGRKVGWAATIREQRRRIRRRVQRSPSLAAYPGEVLGEEYADARLAAADETDLPVDAFPNSCPFTIEQVLDPDFWPEANSK